MTLPVHGIERAGSIVKSLMKDSARWKERIRKIRETRLPLFEKESEGAARTLIELALQVSSR